MARIEFFLVICLAFAPAWSSPDRKIEEAERAANESTIVFELFTRANPTVADLLKLGDLEILQGSHYDPRLPTEIFAHGWIGNPSHGYPTRDAFLQREECNFISIDWSKMASGPYPYPTDYPYIVEFNIPKVGRHVGAFFDFLVENAAADLSTFHLAGWSLGAHVAGWAGATVSGRLPRITGLDPAAPFFNLNDTTTRLDITDADFVDVIHTNGGVLLDGDLAFLEPIGHVDFYPNGGERQPGCHRTTTPSNFPSKSLRNECDHDYAPAFYAESVISALGFRAVECASYEDFQAGVCDNNPSELMGEPTPSSARGVYYLATNTAPPYALG